MGSASLCPASNISFRNAKGRSFMGFTFSQAKFAFCLSPLLRFIVEIQISARRRG
jgi:hypothetical protein